VVDLLKRRFGIEFARDVVRQGDLVEAVEVALEEVGGGIERVMGIEAVERKQPGIGVTRVPVDEVDRHLDAPGGLVVLLGDAGLDVDRPRVRLPGITPPLLAEPSRVVAG